jgi:hypothetical protein
MTWGDRELMIALLHSATVCKVCHERPSGRGVNNCALCFLGVLMGDLYIVSKEKQLRFDWD